MMAWTLAQWGACAKTLPAHTRVFVSNDVFEALCLTLIANDRVATFEPTPTWGVRLRTIRVTPDRWRDRSAA